MRLREWGRILLTITMGLTEIIRKLRDNYFWGNILGMIVVVVVLVGAAWIGLDFYTMHGKAVVIPEVRFKSMVEARRMLEEQGLVVMVTDTGYVKSLPADYVLEQSPASGEKVKPGHVVSIIVNASHTPTLTLPDIIQNSSLREAIAKLKAMGFKVGTPQYVDGEKDWIYGATVNGRPVMAGDRVPIDVEIILQAGSGMASEEDSADFVNSHMGETDDFSADDGDIDDFVEIP